MSSDKRITWEQLLPFIVTYLAANCYHYKNSNNQNVEEFENAIYGFIDGYANTIIMFFANDKKTKLKVREIAKNSRKEFVILIKLKEYKNARENTRKNINEIMELLLGQAVFNQLQKAFEVVLKIIKNSPEKLTDEEKILVQSANYELEKRLVDLKLVNS